MDISNYKKTNIFFIVETLYGRDSLLPAIGLLGPSLMQVHRTVYETNIKQDAFLDGERINLGHISLHHIFSYYTGSNITTKESKGHEILFNMVYSGSELISSPVSGLDADKFEKLSKQYKLPSSIFNFGKDPVPQVKLYGRSGLSFFMENGGKDAPMAAAKYDKVSGKIIVIKSKGELSKLMLEIQKNKK